MAFKLSDFKKTARGTSDGRQLYPHQIRDERHTASLGFAISYFERMVSRRRAEFETEALMEFFGDPRLARGFVACLASTYTWRTPELREALGEEAAAVLTLAGVRSPADLRARLYALANERFQGFVAPEERASALETLCAALSAAAEEARHQLREWSQADLAAPQALPLAACLTPMHLETALILDAESEQLLVKQGPTPTPDEVLARYNFHSLETAICYAEGVRLQLQGPIWAILRSIHNLVRRYRLSYSLNEAPASLFDNTLDLTIHGRRDALGGWGRAGRRLARALLRLLAAHPGCVASGEALSHAGGKRATVRLDKRALQVLGVGLGAEAHNAAEEEREVWEDQAADELQRAWSRVMVRGRTAGWRMRRDPDPLLGGATVVVPDFALRRGARSLGLCLVPGRTAAAALSAGLSRLGRGTPVVVLAQEDAALTLRSGPSVVVVTYAERPADAIPRLVTALERAWPREAVAATPPDPWLGLAQRVAAEGFVDEAAAASLLSCAPGEVAAAVRRRAPTGLHALSGLGVCDGETLGEIRELLDRTRDRAA